MEIKNDADFLGRHSTRDELALQSLCLPQVSEPTLSHFGKYYGRISEVHAENDLRPLYAWRSSRQVSPEVYMVKGVSHWRKAAPPH